MIAELEFVAKEIRFIYEGYSVPIERIPDLKRYRSDMDNIRRMRAILEQISETDSELEQRHALSQIERINGSPIKA